MTSYHISYIFTPLELRIKSPKQPEMQSKIERKEKTEQTKTNEQKRVNYRILFICWSDGQTIPTTQKHHRRMKSTQNNGMTSRKRATCTWAWWMSDKLFTVRNFQNSQHKFAKSLSSFQLVHEYEFEIAPTFTVTLIHNSCIRFYLLRP